MPFIRWAVRRDLPEMLAIEQASFPLPWSENDFLRCLRERNTVAMVATESGIESPITGFMVYGLLKSAIGLYNLAVAPGSRRQGIGRAMTAKLQSKLSASRRNRLVALVRESNLDAHLFLRACGLRAERVHRGYFEDTDEAAYRFVYRLGVESAVLETKE